MKKFLTFLFSLLLIFSSCSLDSHYVRMASTAKTQAIECAIKEKWINESQRQDILLFVTTIHVHFVDGMPTCDGPVYRSDGQLHPVLGCYVTKENTIEVGLVDWTQVDNCNMKFCVPFRWDSDIENTIRHEYDHAIQIYLIGHSDDVLLGNCK